MGILSWWKGNGGDKTNSHSQQQPPSPSPNPNTNTKKDSPAPKEAPGMNGAVEVPRAAVTVFEFGSVAASADKVTLAGYCPVSDDLEPCRWEILPAADAGAPQFRVAF